MEEKVFTEEQVATIIAKFKEIEDTIKKGKNLEYCLGKTNPTHQICR